VNFILGLNLPQTGIPFGRGWVGEHRVERRIVN